MPIHDKTDGGEEQSASVDAEDQARRLPTQTAHRFVRYVVGFGVAVGVGLAAYLGKLDVPLFTPLLRLIPMNMQDMLLPLSAALMGIVAVAVQWFGTVHLSRTWLRRNFVLALVSTVVLFVVLIIVHSLVVVRVPIDNASSTVGVLVGWDTRPIVEPCGARISDSECIQKISLDPAQVESMWGSSSMRRAQVALTLAYLGFTGVFGWLVGLLVLLPEQEQTVAESPGRKSAP